MSATTTNTPTVRKSFAKKIEHFILNIHQSNRNSPIIGKVTGFIRAVRYHPRFRSIYLRFFGAPEAWNVYVEAVGKKADRAIFHEALNSRVLRLTFDKYHARDFTVVLLYLLVRTLKPEVVMETGISSGRSSTAILEALHVNSKGKLYSFDLPKLTSSHVQQTVTIDGKSYRQYIPPDQEEPGWLVPEDLKDRWVKTLGDSNVELPKIVATLDKIDIFFHDGDHTESSMTHEYETTWPKIPKEGLLLSDDVPASDSFSKFIKKYPHAYDYTYNGLGIIVK